MCRECPKVSATAEQFTATRRVLNGLLGFAVHVVSGHTDDKVTTVAGEGNGRAEIFIGLENARCGDRAQHPHTGRILVHPHASRIAIRRTRLGDVLIGNANGDDLPIVRDCNRIARIVAGNGEWNQKVRSLVPFTVDAGEDGDRALCVLLRSTDNHRVAVTRQRNRHSEVSLFVRCLCGDFGDLRPLECGCVTAVHGDNTRLGGSTNGDVRRTHDHRRAVVRHRNGLARAVGTLRSRSRQRGAQVERRTSAEGHCAKHTDGCC